MNIQIQFVDTRKIASVEEMIQEKLKHLESKFDFIVYAEVFIKEEKNSDGRGHICEIRLGVPGPDLFASTNETSFEKAVAETIDELDRQLVKHKEKMKRH